MCWAVTRSGESCFAPEESMRIRLIFAVLALIAQSAAFAEPSRQVEIVATGIGFGEGTVFVGDQLYFVDYAASTIYRLDDRRPSVVRSMEGCGANGLLSYKGELLVACYDSGTVQQVTIEGKFIQSIDRASTGAKFVRPNDLARANRDGVYFTASGGEDGVPGKVFYMSNLNAKPREVASAIQNANGIAVSPDGKVLYVGESTTDKILQYDIASDGSLLNRRDLVALDKELTATQGRHTPDGIRTDRLGRIFVSLYNGGGFAIFNANGRLMADIPLPGEHHANLALSPDEKYVFGTIANSSTAAGQAGAIYRTLNPQPN